MASRIAGITVEIGGDTTKLSKALESVNKTIKTTQSELKDVNKLLKLDPSNTEAVTQKQRIGASVFHPFHVKVAAVCKIVPGRLSADPALVEPEAINHRPHRLPLRKSPRRQSPRLPK